MGIFGGTSTPDYPHGNNGQSGWSSSARHGKGSGGGTAASGGNIADGATHGGGETAG